jgi:hypothetical protein
LKISKGKGQGDTRKPSELFHIEGTIAILCIKRTKSNPKGKEEIIIFGH